MSVQTLLHLEALERATSELANYEHKLEEFVKADFERVKNDLTSAIAHYRGEVARLRGEIPPAVMAHIDEGQHPQVAVKLAAESAKAAE